MLVLAHRGSGPSGPERENTVPAFLASRRSGADGVELDVRRSADGALVIHHDAVLADGRRLCELERAELPGYVPGLAEALDACGGLVVNIEVKNSPMDPDFDPSEGVADDVASLLNARAARGRARDLVIVSSFSLQTLWAVTSAARGVETAWLAPSVLDADQIWEIASGAGLRGVHPFETVVDAAFVERARREQLAVRAWTVDDPLRVVELARAGVDAVITNDVAASVQARRMARLA
jgi:glycerophosphoryl diester phosphodiesterase